MKYIVKKTTELTEKEITEICDVFNNVFVGHNTNNEFFKNTYMNTPLGYSFHGLMLYEGVVVGVHNNIPYYYIYKGQKLLFAYGSGTMVLKEFRDFYNFASLYKKTEEYAIENGVVYLFGFPNESSHTVFVKGFKHRDLLKLDIYILPKKIGAIRSGLKYFNFISDLCCRFMLLMSYFSTNRTAYDYMVHKDLPSFNACRYNLHEGVYHFIVTDDFRAVYRIKEHEGIETAFLMDVQPMSPYNFNKAIRTMYRQSKNIEMVMYVGYLRFTPLSIFKVSKKIAPKTFHFTGKILDADKVDEEIFDISNWDVNLSNYDLL